MARTIFTTLVRVLVAPLMVLARLLGVALRLLVSLLKALLVVLVLVAVVVFALQAAGMTVDLDAVGDVPIPGGDGDAVDPGDPTESAYNLDDGDINSTAVEREIHAEVNERRTARGLDPLGWDQTVASVSRAHSKDMADREYFSHTNPDGEGPHDRYQAVGNGCFAYGENIAMSWAGRPVDIGEGDSVTYTTNEELAEGLVRQWMESPGHRENLLRENWESGGVGVYITEDGQVYATHNFCRGLGL